MEEEIHKQLAELQNQLYKLKTAVEYIDQAKTVIESSDKLVKSFSEIHVEYDSLKKATQNLIEKIDNVDFPKRLDSIRDTITSINIGIGNLQTRLENMFVELNSKLNNHTNLLNALSSKSDENKNVLVSKLIEVYKDLSSNIDHTQITLDQHSKKLKFIKTFSVISSIFLFILLLLIVYKLFLV